MSFMAKAKEFLMGKQWNDRIDLERQYFNKPYQRAVEYYEQNKSVSGTEAVMQKITEERQRYVTEMKQYIAQERPREEACFSKRREMGVQKQKFKWFFFGGALVFYLLDKAYVGAHSSGIRSLLSLLELAVFIFVVISLLIALLYKGREVLAAKAYERYLDEANAGFDRISGPYKAMMQSLYTEIDDLYLASLDPAHRENVLLRRDLARQHEEAMRLQKQTLEHQRGMEEEQRRARRT